MNTHRPSNHKQLINNIAALHISTRTANAPVISTALSTGQIRALWRALDQVPDDLVRAVLKVAFWTCVPFEQLLAEKRGDFNSSTLVLTLRQPNGEAIEWQLDYAAIFMFPFQDCPDEDLPIFSVMREINWEILPCAPSAATIHQALNQVGIEAGIPDLNEQLLRQAGAYVTTVLAMLPSE